MPAARPRGRPPKRASEEEAIEAPVAARPRAKSRARSASVASTVAYEDTTLRPVPKKRGRPPKNVVLPTEEDAKEHEEAEVREVRRRGKEIALQTRVATNIQKYARPKAKAKAKPTKSAAEPAVPSAAPPVRKPRVKKVAIEASPRAIMTISEKRPRGRPKGSLGKKKRDVLLEEELRRLASVEV